MLANFAQGAADLYDNVAVFDESGDINWSHFEWLTDDPESDFDFELSDIKTACEGDRIVTSSLRGLLSDGELKHGIKIDQLRYWDQSELLRKGGGRDEVREFVREHLQPFGINNRELEQYYRDLGFEDVIYLDNWIRSDRFVHDPDAIEPGLIGHQPDKRRSNTILQPILSASPWLPPQLSRWDTDYRRYELYNRLQTHFGEERTLLCEGAQAEVARRMQRSDFFVFFNAFADDTINITGETFGLSLYEAMACGCVCIARRHDGNKFLSGTIPLTDNINQVVEIIEKLSESEKKEIRARSLELVAKRYRFNDDKRQRMRELLE